MSARLDGLASATEAFGAGGVIAGSIGKGGKIGSWLTKLFAKEEAASDTFQGVKEASQYLQQNGFSRARRVEILQSFEVGTVKVRAAGTTEYGLRYYDGVDALHREDTCLRRSLLLVPAWLFRRTGTR